MISVTLTGNPIPAARARAGRGNHFYTPKRYAEYKERLAWALRAAVGDAGPMTGPVQVEAHFYRQTRGRVDLDNLLKAVLDAATEAGVWVDDSQVRRFTDVSVELGSKEPRAEIMVTEPAAV